MARFGETPHMPASAEGLEKDDSELKRDLADIERAGDKKETIKESQKARRNLLGRVMRSKALDLAGNLIQGIDIAKMTAEACRGITTSGEILSNEKRFSYAAISAVTATAYFLAMNDAGTAAVAARGSATLMSFTEFGPEVVKMVAERIQKKKPKLAEFMEKTAEYFKGKKDLFVDAGARMALAVNNSM